METSDQSSPEALCQEILAQAQRQAEEIVGHAQQEAAALLARAATQAERSRQERLALARDEAGRQRELILATVPLEAGQQRGARVEVLLQGIYDEGRRQILEGRATDQRATVIGLAIEAMNRMAGDAFVLKLSAGARIAIGDGLVEEIQRRLGRASLRITLSDDPTITDGGLLVEDEQGRQVWDNRLTARLDRMWPELRRQIAIDSFLIEASAKASGQT